MVNRTHVVFKAADRSYFAILKKEIHGLAVSAGFSEKKVGEIDIIIAEMASNLVKHAGGGQILVKLVEENGVQGIEIISIDEGPGMLDISRMVADGVSTKNTLGMGLGAMKRLADFFQVYSLKDWGTVILIRLFQTDLPQLQKLPIAEIRSIVLPKPGEEACGDGFYTTFSDTHIRLFLGDGLGHGQEAERAVQTAGQAFHSSTETEPTAIIRTIDSAVRKTRGLVGTVAVFDLQARVWHLCGVGNISMRINSPSFSKGYTAYNGIIGLNVPRTLNAQQVAFEKGQHVLMCSDGLKSKWDTLRYTAVLRYDFSILAAAILKDYARNTDDMSVAVCKLNL